MRKITADVNGQLRGEMENLLVECDNLSYAPAGDEGRALDQSLYERAVKVAEAAVKESS